MSDLKRNASSLAEMEASISKKMKTDYGSSQPLLPSPNIQLRSSPSPDTAISPTTSVNFTATVNSDDHFSGRLPLSCLSVSNANIVETINAVINSTTTSSLDLETSVLEKVDSTPRNFELFRKDKYSLNEFCGDSEEMTKMVAKEEIEEFFAMAEKNEQKRFAEKYNYDIVKDMPLQGKYEWVRLI